MGVWGRLGLVLATISRQATAQSCEDGSSFEECVTTPEGCLWELNNDAENAPDVNTYSCVSCSDLDGDIYRCAFPCMFDIETAECALPQPTPFPTLAPLATNSQTGATDSFVLFEMGSVDFDEEKKRGLEEILAATFGAEFVVLRDDGLEVENCGEAPLCATNPQLVDTVGNWESVTLPTLETCCPARDTRKTLPCQTIDPTGEACRVSGLQIPYCDEANDLDSPECRFLALDPGNLTLTVSPVLRDSGDQGGCCLSCTCYGDPNCISFNGTKASWRLCDARDPSRDCRHTRSACESSTDHEGNECKWRQNYLSNWQSGGRCQPDEKAGPSWLLMYAVDDFSFQVMQEERGVIREVFMQTADGNFSMNANDCFAGAALETTWTFSGPDGSLIPVWAENWVRDDLPGIYDIEWYIFDQTTEIQVNIRCTGTANPSGTEYGNNRLNVDAVIDPVGDQSDAFETLRIGATGFCVTGSLIDETTTVSSLGSLLQHLEVEKQCGSIRTDVNILVTLEIARTLCGTSTTINGIPLCFNSFCEQYARPNQEVAECKDHFKNENPEKAFCHSVSASQIRREQCKDNIDEFGWGPTTIDFFMRVESQLLECVNRSDELPTSLRRCEEGVVLQFQAVPGDDHSWTDYLAFPKNQPLCNGTLIFTAASDRVLFTSPIRFEQCSLEPSCGVLEKCMFVPEFLGNLSFVHNDFNIGRPSRSPTPRPTQNPTLSPVPTRSPTDTPTITPTTLPPTRSPASTDSPTESPTGPPTNQPTESPTRSPTDGPTESPTRSPTHSPTDGPTESPSRAPTTSKPTSSLSPTTKPTRSPTQKPSVKPTKGPTSSPTKLPTTTPTESCEQVACPPSSGGETPPLFQNQNVATTGDDACIDDISFTTDIIVATYCDCDFDVNGALFETSKGGTSVDLSFACPSVSDTLQQTSICSLMCDEIGCDAWTLDDSVCEFYNCNGNTPDFIPEMGSISAEKCIGTPTGRPVLQPTHFGWTPGRRRVLGSSSARSDAMERRQLRTPGRVVFQFRLWAVFASGDEQEASTAVTSSNTEVVIQSANDLLQLSSTFEDVRDSAQFLQFYSSETYKVDDLRFVDTVYNPVIHNDEAFLEEVCLVLERAVQRFGEEFGNEYPDLVLSSVICESSGGDPKLVNFRSYGDSNGRLVVFYRIINVIPGSIQSMLELQEGMQIFQEELEASPASDVSVLVLSAFFETNPPARKPVPSAAIVVPLLLVVLAVVGFGVVVVRRRRRQKMEQAEEMKQALDIYERVSDRERRRKRQHN